MAYVKNIWVDQDVERPKTYEVTNNQDGSITLTDSFGLVTELGTPVNAVNMNHIEDGLVDTDVTKYNATTTYNAGEWVTGVVDNEKGIYASKVNSNTGNALTNDTYWEKVELGGGSRNIGEIVLSTIPLTDAGLHLLDGALISGNGSYADFVTYISGLVSNYPDLFISESDWQTSVTTYGSCGKFVYNSTNNTVRIPKISNIIEGTSEVNALGDLVEAGLPNITGDIGFRQNVQLDDLNSGVFTSSAESSSVQSRPPSLMSGDLNSKIISFDASSSNSIYGNSSTVQPQTIKTLIYIVVANTTKTEIEVDIDNIATDVNGKADIDGSNMAASVKNFDGQWVSVTNSPVELFNGNSRTTDLAINISSYLPNDSYDYEVFLQAYAATGTSSGNTALCWLSSDKFPQVRVCQCRTRSSSQVQAEGNAIIPVHTKSITIKGYVSNTGSTILQLVGYRRIGTNS